MSGVRFTFENQEYDFNDVDAIKRALDENRDTLNAWADQVDAGNIKDAEAAASLQSLNGFRQNLIAAWDWIISHERKQQRAALEKAVEAIRQIERLSE